MQVSLPYTSGPSMGNVVIDWSSGGIDVEVLEGHPDHALSIGEIAKEKLFVDLKSLPIYKKKDTPRPIPLCEMDEQEQKEILSTVNRAELVRNQYEIELIRLIYEESSSESR